MRNESHPKGESRKSCKLLIYKENNGNYSVNSRIQDFGKSIFLINLIGVLQ